MEFNNSLTLNPVFHRNAAPYPFTYLIALSTHTFLENTVTVHTHVHASVCVYVGVIL